MWKHLKLLLSGGLPNAAKYEQQQAHLHQQCQQYEVLRQTPYVKRYQEIAAQIATPRRQSGLSKQEHKLLRQELSLLLKSTDVSAFFHLQKKNHNFKEILQWEEFFYDDFAAPTLDPLKWQIYRPAADAHLPEIQYSPAQEHQILTTDGSNLQVGGGALQICTRKEPAQGVVFSNVYGFVPAERNFTSGIINTGDTCRLVYGKAEVKFRYNSSSKYVYHSICMSAGKRLPQVNVVRIGRKTEFGVFAANPNGTGITQHSAVYRRGFLKPNTDYVLRVEWRVESMEWFINGKRIFTAPNLLHEPLFLAFTSGIAGKEPQTQKPSTLEIQWVKMCALNK
jgi:hypothetical protein